MTDAAPRPFARRLAGQGALLLSGYGLAQAASFGRNAIVAHWLSKGDFGIAAAILLLLQMLETLSDLGADRLIVQARDGDDPRLIANAHATLALRGSLIGGFLLAFAHPMASFFRVEPAAWAFAAVAAVPLLKGFMHLDMRLAQRRLDNRPQMLIETLPQLMALALAYPFLRWFGDYSAVVWLSIAQAVAALAVSHAVAKSPYRIGFDGDHMRRLIAFGWPILASAFPLVAVYQGDRMLIGRLVGMEGLAAYTAAFMITMVPGLLAAKVSNALLLPLLAAERDNAVRFTQRFHLMAELVAFAASLYLATFLVAGGTLLPIAFGANYGGLGSLVGWLALMWAIRMLQAVPGAALLAKGVTRPFVVAGLVRAGGLALALAALLGGYGLTGAAAAGALAEFASLAYVTWRLDRSGFHEDGSGVRLGSAFAVRGWLLLPAGALAWLAASAAGSGLAYVALMTIAVALGVGVIAAAVPGEARRHVTALLGSSRA